MYIKLMSKLLTTTQAAKKLHISGSYLRDFVAKGIITPSQKTKGGYWLWSEEDIKFVQRILNNPGLSAGRNLANQEEFQNHLQSLRMELDEKYKKLWPSLFLVSTLTGISMALVTWLFWWVLKILFALLAILPASGVGQISSPQLSPLAIVAALSAILSLIFFYNRIQKARKDLYVFPRKATQVAADIRSKKL
jgi:DNA-binding transcriptional MerR regulator